MYDSGTIRCDYPATRRDFGESGSDAASVVPPSRSFDSGLVGCSHRRLAGFLYWLAALVCSAVTLSAATFSTPPYNITNSLSSGTVQVRRIVNAVNAGAARQLYFRFDGGSWQARTLGSGSTGLSSKTVTINSAWTGLSPSSGAVSFTAGPGSPFLVEWSVANDGTADGSAIFPTGPASGSVTYLANDTSTHLLDVGAGIINISATGAISSEDPLAVPEKGDVLLLLNNTTGQPQTVTIQGQEVELLPGMNTVRYQGPVDPITGFPTEGGLPNIPYIGITGQDGVKYAMADYKVNFGSEIGDYYNWSGGNTSATVSGTSVTGAMLTIPGQNGQPTTLIGLPPVSPQPMTNTSATTPTISNPNTTPPTSPPSSGTTSGTVSGSGSGTGTSSGGASVAAAGTAGEGGFYNAPGLGDVLGEGQGIANELKNTIGGVGDSLKGKTWKWWNISEAGLGSDSSWLDTQVVIAGTSFKLVNIDHDWLSWIRQFLVLGIKVTFVFMVIKLFLK
jgi:hypothetical protein